MGFLNPHKEQLIVTFTRDRQLLSALSAFFADAPGVTVDDLLGMGEELAERFIQAYSIDIAFLEHHVIEAGPVQKIIKKAQATPGRTTHFVLRYDDACAVKMLDFGEALLAKKLPLTQFRLDDEHEDEYTILAQTLSGILMGRGSK